MSETLRFRAQVRNRKTQGQGMFQQRLSEHLIFWAVVLGSLVLWMGAAQAQETGGETGYRLGSEDVLVISIMAGGEKQVETEMVVGGNGHVNVPFIGRVKAVGLTLDALEQQITRPLAADYFVAPQVHLQIKEYHSLQFFISGAVKNPGMFELDYTPTVMDLIASAGGVLPERGNIAYILRGTPGKSKEVALDMGEIPPGMEPIQVNLKSMLDQGNMAENHILRSGDTVYIPLNTQMNQSSVKIYVQGEVKKPGVFDFQPGLTALAACIMAGGFDKFAAPNRARVIRRTQGGQETINLNLEKVQTGDAEDLLLIPGDRIHIPESWL